MRLYRVLASAAALPDSLSCYWGYILTKLLRYSINFVVSPLTGIHRLVDFNDVDTVERLPGGSVRLVDVEGTEVAVFNIGSQLYAIDDARTHDGGTLAEGNVRRYELECPRQG
jgi:hypothetical protein